MKHLPFRKWTRPCWGLIFKTSSKHLQSTSSSHTWLRHSSSNDLWRSTKQSEKVESLTSERHVQTIFKTYLECSKKLVRKPDRVNTSVETHQTTLKCPECRTSRSGGCPRAYFMCLGPDCLDESTDHHNDYHSFVTSQKPPGAISGESRRLRLIQWTSEFAETVLLSTRGRVHRCRSLDASLSKQVMHYWQRHRLANQGTVEREASNMGSWSRPARHKKKVFRLNVTILLFVPKHCSTLMQGSNLGYCIRRSYVDCLKMSAISL